MEKSELVMSLNGAAGVYLSSLDEAARKTARPVVTRFVMWYGRDKLCAAMSGSEVARYADQMSRTEVGLSEKLAQLRGFLTFAYKKGWLRSSMAVHVKAAKKSPAKNTPLRRPAVKKVSETKQGAEKMKVELEELKKKRAKTVEDLRIAAADKDLRENAPYHSAREQLSHIDGRIKQIEATLKVLVVVDDGESDKCGKIGLGNKIVLKDLASGEELEYSVVGPKEVDPLRGCISAASPIGKAVMGHCVGDEIEAVAPARKLRYRVKKISR